MTVLVTGVAGFIGSQVGGRLLEHGHRVVGEEDHEPRVPVSLARTADLVDPNQADTDSRVR